MGGTEHPHVDATPLERRTSISLDRLLDKAGMYELDEDDGARLAQLMVRHGLGVQPELTVTLHQLDEDFFESL